MKTRHVNELFVAGDGMAAVDQPAVMSMEDVIEATCVMRVDCHANERNDAARLIA